MRLVVDFFSVVSVSHVTRLHTTTFDDIYILLGYERYARVLTTFR